MKTMHLGVSGAAGQRAFLKTEHKLDLSMHIEMYQNLPGKTMHSGVNEAVWQRELAKLSIHYTSIWTAKCQKMLGNINASYNIKKHFLLP